MKRAKARQRVSSYRRCEECDVTIITGPDINAHIVPMKLAKFHAVDLASDVNDPSIATSMIQVWRSKQL